MMLSAIKRQNIKRNKKIGLIVRRRTNKKEKERKTQKKPSIRRDLWGDTTLML
ncbi:MAG: hypothetical protein QXT67_08010 [Candidatus Bathyarchaeia archaeon]